jgi:hypothetical protein
MDQLQIMVSILFCGLTVAHVALGGSYAGSLSMSRGRVVDVYIYIVEVESRGVRARRHELYGRLPLFVFVHAPSYIGP